MVSYGISWYLGSSGRSKREGVIMGVGVETVLLLLL